MARTKEDPRVELTYNPTITQFSHGNPFHPEPATLTSPVLVGRMYMQVRAHIMPGISIEDQPDFPGRLKLEVMDVLPIGYHDVMSCEVPKIWISGAKGRI